MISAHIAGIPVEETLLSFAPIGLVGIGVALATARERMAAAWAGIAGACRRVAHPRRNSTST
jgi:hypothetical protein